jgi:hypothetical protein
MLLPNAVFGRISDPKPIEKEPQNNKHFPPDERVRRMFILAVLPDKDREMYGLFTPYASCLFVQSINWSNAGSFTCSESYGAFLHVEFLNRITYEGPFGGTKCLLTQLAWSLLTLYHSRGCVR